ncbi:hypothetical protein GF360_01200 [candidate division WWE3 bacterium]|nr:hypothetical protein [candidate division WWE3 bacterium]
MNNSYQAKNGFKTFLVTLIISLGVFAAVYYLTSYPTYQLDIEESTGDSMGRVESLEEDVEASDEKGAVAGDKDAREEDSAESPFADLNKTEVSVPRRSVLAGADGATEEETATGTTTTTTTTPETTESTVPDTGILSITLSLVASLVILGGGIYYVYLGPRNLALESFEDKFLN